MSQTNKEILLLKIGGSSITKKAELETLNEQAMEWFSQTIRLTINDDFLGAGDDGTKVDSVTDDCKPAMIIVHGAGSFGHHTAKQYGLKGQTSPPPNGMHMTRDLRRGIVKTRHR